MFSDSFGKCYKAIMTGRHVRSLGETNSFVQMESKWLLRPSFFLRIHSIFQIKQSSFDSILEN